MATSGKQNIHMINFFGNYLAFSMHSSTKAYERTASFHAFISTFPEEIRKRQQNFDEQCRLKEADREWLDSLSSVSSDKVYLLSYFIMLK